MKSVIHQALGNINSLHAGLLFEWSHIDNELVGHEPVPARVENGEVFIKPLGHVVGVQDRDLGRLGQSWCSHE